MLDLSELDDGHLVALVKALHEARFCDEPRDPLVWTSPFVADLHEWALEEHRRRTEAGGRGTSWDRFLTWAGRSEEQVVITRLRDDDRLRDLVMSDPEVLREMLRPFRVEDADVKAMIDASNSALG
jgi:hypothetical protein